MHRIGVWWTYRRARAAKGAPSSIPIAVDFTTRSRSASPSLETTTAGVRHRRHGGPSRLPRSHATGTISSRFQTTPGRRPYATQPAMAAPTDPATVRRAAPIPPQPIVFNSAMPVYWFAWPPVFSRAPSVFHDFNRERPPGGHASRRFGISSTASTGPNRRRRLQALRRQRRSPRVAAGHFGTATCSASATGAGNDTSLCRTFARTLPGSNPGPDAAASRCAWAARLRSATPPPPLSVRRRLPSAPAPDSRGIRTTRMWLFPITVSSSTATPQIRRVAELRQRQDVLNRQGGTLISDGVQGVERRRTASAQIRKDPRSFAPDNLDMPGICHCAAFAVRQSPMSYLAFSRRENLPKVSIDREPYSHQGRTLERALVVRTSVSTGPDSPIVSGPSTRPRSSL